MREKGENFDNYFLVLLANIKKLLEVSGLVNFFL